MTQRRPDTNQNPKIGTETRPEYSQTRPKPVGSVGFSGGLSPLLSPTLNYSHFYLFILNRLDNILTYNICSLMIVFYHQVRILINFWYKRGSNPYIFFNN